jgi:hypothetical protein
LVQLAKNTPILDNNISVELNHSSCNNHKQVYGYAFVPVYPKHKSSHRVLSTACEPEMKIRTKKINSITIISKLEEKKIDYKAYKFMQKSFLDAFIFPETLEVISSKTERYLLSMILQCQNRSQQGKKKPK